MNQLFRIPHGRFGALAAALLGVISGGSMEAASNVIQIGPARVQITTDSGSVSEPSKSWLGVSTSAVPRELRDRLSLPEGFYLRVDTVEPGSPADRAGVRAGDVLTRFGDQMLVNPEQLRVLVRAQQPGGEVPLSVLRDGAALSFPVRLDEKPAASPIPGLQFNQPGAGSNAWLSIGPEGVHISTKDMPDELKKLAEGIKGLSEIDGEKLEQQLRNQLQEGFKGSTSIDISSSSRATKRRGADIVSEDDEMQIKLTRNKDGQHLRVKGKGGHILYDGPLDSEADWRKLPAEVRKKVEEIEAAKDGR